MLWVPPPPIPLRFPLYNPTALCALPCARSLKRAQTNLVYFVCITQTLSPAMTQRIHIQLITRIYSKKAWMASLVNPRRPLIHITHIQMNLRCVLGTGTGTKALRSLETISRNYSTLSVTPRFHHLPFLKPDGVPSTRNSAEITLMATYCSGWAKMMVESVHQLQYWCPFIPAQVIQGVKTILFKDSITVPSFPLCEKKFLIPHMQCSFTTNCMNCNGAHHIGMTTWRSTVNCSILLHSSRNISGFRTPPLNLAVTCLTSSRHLCSGLIRPSWPSLAMPSCGLSIYFLGTNPSIRDVSQQTICALM